MNGVRIPAIHAGKDFDGNQGEPVFAVANGEVIKQNPYLTGYGPNGDPGGALIAQFKTSDGSVFRALYGHIDNPHELGSIHAGEILGYINSYNPSHLHFGIHPGDKDPSDTKDYRGFIRKDEYTGDTHGWVNPLIFLNTYEPPEDVVGEWTVHYQWPDSNGDNSNGYYAIFFRDDGTFSISYDSNTVELGDGTWNQNGDAVSWKFDYSARAVYDGTIKSSSMSGTMSDDRGVQGEWSADKRYYGTTETLA
jgi:hypothetical protein